MKILIVVVASFLAGCVTPAMGDENLVTIDTRVSAASSLPTIGKNVTVITKVDSGCVNKTYPKPDDVTAKVEKFYQRESTTGSSSALLVYITLWNCQPLSPTEAEQMLNAGYGTFPGNVSFGTYNPLIDIPIYLANRSSETDVSALVTDIKIDRLQYQMRIITRITGKVSPKKQKEIFISEILKKLSEVR